MKKFLSAALLVASSLFSYGQYYYLPYVNAGVNPGNINQDLEYPYQGGLDASWSVLLTGSNSTPTWSSNFTLPFSFDVNGNSFTDCKVSSTGVLTFDVNATTVPAANLNSMPNASIPDNSICILGLNGVGSNDNVMVKTFGTAPNRQQWFFFSSYDANGSSAGCWTYWSIVLEETTNKFYIVDQRTTSACGNITFVGGIQIDASTAYSTTTLSTNTNNSPAVDDNSYYEFIQGVQNSYDAAVTGLTLPDFLVIGNAPFTIGGDFYNFGTQTINNYNVNYSINNGAAVTASGTGNVAMFNSGSFTHSTNWTPTATGQYTVKVWLSDLNGNADQNTANDYFEKTVEVVENFYQRLPLYEVFTGSTCPPCKPGNENLHAQLANYPESEYVLVKYQQDFPGTGDPYCTDETVARRNYYAINSIPRMEIDGGWDQNASAFTSALHESTKAIPSFVEINATWVNKDSLFTVDVELNPASDISGNIVLHVGLLEHETTQNVKSNGETEFTQVVKKMIPNQNGTSVGNLTNGTAKTASVSFQLVGDYRLPSNGQSANRINHAIENSVEEVEDLYVVVWLQNSTTKEVYQAAYAVQQEPSSVQAAAMQQNALKAYPNPANDAISIELPTSIIKDGELEIYSVNGQLIEAIQLNGSESAITVKNINVSAYEAGMYFAKYNSGNAQHIVRFSVAH